MPNIYVWAGEEVKRTLGPWACHCLSGDHTAAVDQRTVAFEDKLDEVTGLFESQEVRGKGNWEYFSQSLILFEFCTGYSQF